MSWINTSKDPYYIEAIEATEGLGKPAKGFIQTEDVGNIARVGPELIRQNNTAIELLVKIATKLDVIETRLQRIENIQGGSSSEELQKSIHTIQKGIEKLKIGEQVPPKLTRKVYHFVDPQKIYDEVKRKQ